MRIYCVSLKRVVVLLCSFLLISTALIWTILLSGEGQTKAAAAYQNKLNIIIDPGHGGEDGGAVSISGIYESTINLDISLKLEQLLAFYGISPVMTRESDNIEYPDDADSVRERKRADQNNRLDIINNTENAVLISIHQNKYTSSEPFGPQVLYADTTGSEEFGTYLQSLMVEFLIPDNRRSAILVSEDIYIMNNVSCPAVLIECGFLSNDREEALIKSEEYKLKTASVIAVGVINSYDILNTVYSGGTNES